MFLVFSNESFAADAIVMLSTPCLDPGRRKGQEGSREVDGKLWEIYVAG